MTKPIIAPDLPGRNDPCPCGSHQKFKRCCRRFTITKTEREKRHIAFLEKIYRNEERMQQLREKEQTHEEEAT